MNAGYKVQFLNKLFVGLNYSIDNGTPGEVAYFCPSCILNAAFSFHFDGIACTSVSGPCTPEQSISFDFVSTGVTTVAWDLPNNATVTGIGLFTIQVPSDGPTLPLEIEYHYTLTLSTSRQNMVLFITNPFNNVDYFIANIGPVATNIQSRPTS